MICLLLGGPHDGRVIETEYPTVKFPICTATPSWFAGEELLDVPIATKCHVYGHRFLRNADRSPNLVALQYQGVR